MLLALPLYVLLLFILCMLHRGPLCTVAARQAIKLGFNDTRCVMEPAGALAIAGMRKYVKEQGLVGHSVSCRDMVGDHPPPPFADLRSFLLLSSLCIRAVISVPFAGVELTFLT